MQENVVQSLLMSLSVFVNSDVIIVQSTGRQKSNNKQVCNGEL